MGTVTPIIADNILKAPAPEKVKPCDTPRVKIIHLITIYSNLCESPHPQDILQCIAMAKEIKVQAEALALEDEKRKNNIIKILGGKV